MTEKSKVSIIVVAFDHPDYLMKTLKSITESTDYPNYELIISDNSIGLQVEKEIEDVCKEAASFDGPSRFVYQKNTQNLLHGRGCMAGFEQSDPKSEFICFCNDDIFIPLSQANWLRRLVEFLETAPNVATITPSLYTHKEKLYWCGKQDSKKPLHDYLHLPRGDQRIPTEPIETCYNNMAVLLTRKNLVENFPIGQTCVHYGSDSEFGNRIKKQYPKMVHMVLPEIKLYHYNIYNKRINHGQDKRIEG
jgi:GT2 family glycosyltransferase